MTPEAPALQPRPSSVWERLRQRPDPLTSVALTLPVFVFYQLGVVSVDRTAQVDLVSKLALSLLRASVPMYVVTTLALTLALAGGVWLQQKRGLLPVTSSIPVLLESLGFALALLMTIGFATNRVAFGLDANVLATLSALDKLVLAAGNGFHEELVFRALGLSGGAWLLERAWGVRGGTALGIAVVFSSLAFALANAFGALAEPFSIVSFAYHALLGGLLAGLYLVRGFAVAVYSHALYSGLVFFVYS